MVQSEEGNAMEGEETADMASRYSAPTEGRMSSAAEEIGGNADVL